MNQSVEPASYDDFAGVNWVRGRDSLAQECLFCGARVGGNGALLRRCPDSATGEHWMVTAPSTTAGAA